MARLMRPDTTVVAGDDALWGVLPLPGAPTDDPGLVLAGARRLARDGQVEKALVGFREAERLLDDPGFGRRCAAERRRWASGCRSRRQRPAAVPPGADADSALLRLSLELRQLTRDVRHPESYDPAWRPALAYLLAGDLAARRVSSRSRGQPGPTAPSLGAAAAGWPHCLAQAISVRRGSAWPARSRRSP